MNYYAVERTGSSDTLEHHGVLGMRWGIRPDSRPIRKQLREIIL